MNWVPFYFIDDVCHQLSKPTFNPVSQLSGSWSSFGSEHGDKRREFGFRCSIQSGSELQLGSELQSGSELQPSVSDQEVSYSLRETNWFSRQMTIEDLNPEFDRITALLCDSKYSTDTHVSRHEFESDILPTVASLVTNCCWWSLEPQRSAQNRLFFNAFKNSPGFNNITVREQGQESRDFVARQVKLGYVQSLTLYGIDKWPEAEKLAETLKIFVSSTRFQYLNSRDSRMDNFELLELFLKRALVSELKPGACIVTRNTNANRLLDLHPECRDNSKKDEWWIPDSNLRVTLRHFTGNSHAWITMEVEYSDNNGSRI